MSAPVAEPVRARLFVEGRWTDGDGTAPVVDKFSGALIGRTETASRGQVQSAVDGLVRAFESVSLEPYERYRILTRTAELLDIHRDTLARTIVAEAGFPLADALNEVVRAAETARLSAEEAKRLVGEMVPIHGAPGQAHRMAFTLRVPRGVVCAITSFNSPLNMVVHKVAPAIASGNTVVIKAPLTTPLSAARFVELLIEAGLPPTHVALVQGPGAEIGTWLVEHAGIRFFTFTGSTAVGRWLQARVGLRPLVLELGSIAGTIVCADADLDRAAIRSAQSSVKRAGQVCTSTQRLFVHEDVFDAFATRLVQHLEAMPVGDPTDPNTVIGPMISEAEAVRADAWVREAVAAGARCLLGGTRAGSLFHPTVLADVPADARVVCEEIFAPVLTLIRFRSLDRAIDAFNDTPFGLGAGIFTRDIDAAFRAAQRLRVGVVHINDASSSRVDLMPFGGTKDSGIGREGPRYAMQEMTEERLVTVTLNQEPDRS